MSHPGRSYGRSCSTAYLAKGGPSFQAPSRSTRTTRSALWSPSASALTPLRLSGAPAVGGC